MNARSGLLFAWVKVKSVAKHYLTASSCYLVLNLIGKAVRVAETVLAEALYATGKPLTDAKFAIEVERWERTTWRSACSLRSHESLSCRSWAGGIVTVPGRSVVAQWIWPFRRF